MRTGREYREALRDGRWVWVLGVGRVEDITTHPATAAMVDTHARWYDRHFDPEWQDVLLTLPDAAGERRPVAFEIPRTPADLRRLGEVIRRNAFANAGNVTHPPGYGGLVALGILDAVTALGPPDRAAAARAYRDALARSGRFVTLAAPPTPADRFRTVDERIAPRVVRETDAGIVVRGAIGLATALPYVDEVFVPTGGRPPALPEQALWFAVPVNAPGVRIFARPPAARLPDPYLFPLSTRYDELDAQTHFDDVFVPWERVFAYRDPDFTTAAEARDRLVSWLLWHHLVTYLARAEFTLGLALAISDALHLQNSRGAVECLIDLIIATETIRSCLRAAELDPTITPAGFACPGQMHLASGTFYVFQNRQRMAEIVRNLVGQGGVLAPSLDDLSDHEVGPTLEQAFGGGGYTAAQRVALLHLAHDHVASALDAREAAFETHASLGEPGWRMRVQRWFDQYSTLANGVVSVLGDMPKVEKMPKIDLDDLRRIGFYG